MLTSRKRDDNKNIFDHIQMLKMHILICIFNKQKIDIDLLKIFIVFMKDRFMINELLR